MFGEGYSQISNINIIHYDKCCNGEWFSTGGQICPPPRGQLTMSGAIFGCQNLGERDVLLASGE